MTLEPGTLRGDQWILKLTNIHFRHWTSWGETLNLKKSKIVETGPLQWEPWIFITQDRGPKTKKNMKTALFADLACLQNPEMSILGNKKPLRGGS